MLKCKLLIRGEYFLNDWLTKIGNYNTDYIYTYFITEGYYDKYILESLDETSKTAIVLNRRLNAEKVGNKYVYEFIMIPNDPFLNENQVLPPGVELQLSFDRLISDFSVIKTGSNDDLKGTVLELKNVFAQVEYISSPSLRRFGDLIQTNPINYIYDECTVLYKALPTSDQQIRLENLRGGNTPDYVFIGITKSSNLAGASSESAINFKNHGIKEINLTLNGNSCHGYPIKVKNDYPLWPYFKYQDVLGKTHNSNLGIQIAMEDFKNNALFAHKFEGEESTQGWLGVSLTLDKIEGFTENFTLGTKF